MHSHYSVERTSNSHRIGSICSSNAELVRQLWIGAVFVVLLIVGTFLCGSVSAQTKTDGTVHQKLESISGALTLIYSMLENETIDDRALANARIEIDGLSRELALTETALNLRLGEINARIDQLPTPAEGAVDPISVAEERKGLGENKAEIVIQIGRIGETKSLIEETIQQVTLTRRTAFYTALFVRTPVTFDLLEKAGAGAQQEFIGFRSLVADWYRFVLDTKATAFTVSTIAAVTFAIIFLLVTRRVFSSVLYRDPFVKDPSYFSKVLIGFCSATLPSFAFAVFLAITYAFYTYLGILTPKISLITQSLFIVFAGVVFVFYLARAVLAPKLPNWRLVTVYETAAPKLVALALGMALIYGFDALIEYWNEIVAAPLSLTIVKSYVTSLAIGLVILAIGTIRARMKLTDEGEIVAAPLPKWILLPLLVIGFGIILTAISGYVGLARFAAQQIVVTGAILVTMYIGILAGRQIGSEGLLANSRLGRWLQGHLSLQSHTVEQIGMITGVLFVGLVVLIGVPLILLRWGSQPADILLWAKQIFAGVQVGATTISLSSLLLGVVIFAIVLIITRSVQKWVSSSILPRSEFDSGVRDSIRAGIGYTGFGLAVLLAVTSAGVDLSSLAIVAGALSIGIGFGLQNVVSNFVSGLILLIERPIKVGDWIEAGGTSGFVKKISVRATEIETFQHQSMILPNSELINSVVGNWTHKYRGGRVDIPIGVAYGSNVREVEAILYRLASEHPLVLKEPEPFVFFSGFGNSSIDFELRIHLSDITRRLDVSTEIRFAIVEAFEEVGIVIPFPQRDVHIKGADRGIVYERKVPKGSVEANLARPVGED